MEQIPYGRSRKKAGEFELDNGEFINWYKPVIGGVRIDTDFVQQYRWVLTILYQLNRCEAFLLLYLANYMDDDNIIDFSVRHKESFISMCKDKDGSTSFTMNTINNALLTLKKKFLIRTVARGSFLINPKFFFKNTKEKQYNQIVLQLNFEEKNGMHVSVEPYLI